LQNTILTMRHCFFFLLLISLGFYSCGDKALEYKKPDREYVVFAKIIEDSIRQKKGNYLNSSIDLEEFFKRLNSNKNGNDPISWNGKPAFMKGLASSLKLGEEIIRSIGETGYYSFIKFYREGNTPHLVFRLYGDGGLNYHDFELFETDDNIKIADCNLLITGENLSETIRNLMVSSMSFEKVMGITIDSHIDSAQVERIKKVKKVKEYILSQDYGNAAKVMDSIPAEGKKDKIFRYLEITIAASTDEQKYMALMEDYEKAFPNDPSLKLVSIDLYFLRKDYKNALQCLDFLEKKFGNDPVLDFYKGNIYYADGDYKSAVEKFKKATRYADFNDAYDSWLSSCLEIKDYKESMRLADILIKRFEFEAEDLDVVFSGYPDLLRSEEYASWLKRNEL
jgi:tetratricopeptide (TPR) repeat protein